jgi:hypothetical protein
MSANGADDGRTDTRRDIAPVGGTLGTSSITQYRGMLGGTTAARCLTTLNFCKLVPIWDKCIIVLWECVDNSDM